MGETATGQTGDRLRSARQRLPFLWRTGETAATLRFTGAGANRTAVPKMAEPHPASAAPGGPAGRLRLESVDLADGGEPYSDLRPAPAWAGVLRRAHPRQPGSGPAGPRAADLRPGGDEENAW